MDDSKELIKLIGSQSFVTRSSDEYFRVEEGDAFVYMQLSKEQVTDRSLYICDAKKGDIIPGLFCSLSDPEREYSFVIIPRKEVSLSKHELTEDDKELGNKFANKLDNIPGTEEADYQKRFIDWYDNTLTREKDAIQKFHRQKFRDFDAKLDLIGTLFRNKSILEYDFSTDSSLYNAVSVMCDYLKIPLISYDRLLAVKGNDFTLQDMARLSHFITREVTLDKNWYKRDAGMLLGFMKDDGRPVLCVPKNAHTYMMYDIEKKEELVVEEVEANAIEKTAFIIYRHLPDESLTLKDVLLFGIRPINSWDIFVFVLMSIFVALIGLAMPYLNEKLYDNLIPLGLFEPIYQVGLVIFVIMLGNMFFSLVRNLANFRAIKTLEYQIVGATFDRIFKLPQKFIEQFGSIELVNRVSAVSGVFSSTVTSGVTACLGFVLSMFYLYKMFDKCKTLAWRGVIMAIISGIVMYLFGYLRVSKEKQKLEASTKANGMLYQFLSGILKIKVSGMENRSLFEFQKANVEAMKYDMRSARISNAGSIFSSIMAVAYTGIIYYVVIKKKQSLTIGEYTAFTSAYGMFTSAVSQLVNFFLTQASLIPVMDRIKPIFSEPAEVVGLSPTAKALRGEIEICHLSFSYEEDEPDVLHDVNMHIQPGEFIGIVGSSGCGKSTLLKLLLGFEEAKVGNIFYDSRDINTLEKAEMRRQMGVVLQDGKMVVGNIYSNITLANPGMKPSDVEPLLEEVGLAEEIKQMPMGMFTSISEGGGTVSGGQQQRILIARALANDPVILFLDEATSALDNITQQKVCENMAARNITRVMIAHRLSTVKNCDRIYVMNAGRIEEVGAYEELMAKKGLFYELVRRQEFGEV
ncbi:ATP-binding cassette, subfamily C [Butyrivibrio sp. ob235]|uniref:NHLP bacteriocin export ABC transporter permease/ATPase subunit n=1 Tax=Butyrivibrio sp. ob235 TaxID=1761780 RepID=UPI0008D27BED|nr:NHLP bacteriocin export ABC transporter permease/ATPase subunit [Butyrivibrio sp. ob235]SEL90265.1 ATP-binding cassette, subfamily C [Butyrivibrio sp. ob235]